VPPNARGRTPREALVVVKTGEPVHVVLDLAQADGTISGQLSIGGDEPMNFHGWLELIDRLERAAAGERAKWGLGRCD
jgi:hypothetical protein